MPVEILMDDHPMMRTKSAPIVNLFGTADLKALADDMKEAMLSRRGLGLAAVQIGTPIRLILIMDRDTRELTFMANPVLTRKLNRDAVEREGCLSVPEFKWRRIARPAKCEASWQDLDGNPQSGGFSGWTARAVQHEIEHLDGILITDHESPDGPALTLVSAANARIGEPKYD